MITETSTKTQAQAQLEHAIRDVAMKLKRSRLADAAVDTAMREQDRARTDLQDAFNRRAEALRVFEETLLTTD